MTNLKSLPAPFVHCGETTRDRMRDMLLALTPALIAACCLHSWELLVNLAAALIVSAVLQAALALPFKRKAHLSDLSFAVTGAMATLLLPAEAPFWAAAAAAAIAQLIRAAFGGLGKNWFNPALTGAVAVTVFRLAGDEAVVALADPTVVAPISRFIGCATFGPAISCSALLLCLGWLYLLAKGLARPIFSGIFLAVMVVPQLLFDIPVLQTGILGPALAMALYCGSDSVTVPIFRRSQLIVAALAGAAVAAGRIALDLDLTFAAMLLAGPVGRGVDALFAKKALTWEF